MALTSVPGIVVEGVSVALFVAHVEMPITRGECRRNVGLQNVEGSTSIYTGRIWAEYGRQVSGWTFNFEGVFRNSMLGAYNATTGVQPVNPLGTPFDIIDGETYAIELYARRPGWRGTADKGIAWWGFGTFEEVPIPSFDPRSGGLTWRAAGRGQGPLYGPGQPPTDWDVTGVGP
jgi:hypothetical protein